MVRLQISRFRVKREGMILKVLLCNEQPEKGKET